MPRTSGSRAWLSCRLAPDIPTDRGSPVRSVIKWIFEPYLPRSTGFGPVRPPFQGSHVHRVDRAARPVQFTPGAEFVEDQPMEPRPHPGFRPLGESPMSRGSRRSERGGRQLLPCAARGGHEHDRSQDLPVTVPAPAASLRSTRRLRHHALEQLPQLIRHQPLNDPHAGRLPTSRRRPAVSGPFGAARRTDAAPVPDATFRPSLRAVRPHQHALLR